MKATRANLLGEFTGKLDGLIYYRSRHTGKLYVRRCFTFKDHPRHAAYAAIQRNIFGIGPSQGYKADLKFYLLLYNQLPVADYMPLYSWSNLYVKLMFAMQTADPAGIDLATITREEIIRRNLPCRTIRAAIEAGLLVPVCGYEGLDREI